ncbi:MAG: hypothetical protein US30_C0002G0014 [Candidatus Moranbacteria bacterium GW2011_GWF2_36_839]|nr:MAG: hypothetical protein US27_C0003G0014 [Candidatus Moranbacteria bacterium GW2011_GWF1_36_78]KKQ17554.1 MAG: hypothetical protein US30_C0002G0014 [Candidatus Moranbacteria bacterium GW2011_GWF2_36_839]
MEKNWKLGLGKFNRDGERINVLQYNLNKKQIFR